MGAAVDIPFGWSIKQIGELASFLTSGSRGWATYYSESGDIFLRIQNVGQNKLLLKDITLVTPPDTAEARRTQVQEGDVLLSITADLGRTAVVPAGLGRAFINQHLAILRMPEVDPHYVAAYLASPAGQAQIVGLNRQGVKAGLNFDDIRSLQIPLPPLAEQRRIAAILDHAEALRTKRREAIALLEQVGQAQFVEIFGDPASNPKGFQRAKLGEIIEFVGGSQPPKEVFTSEGGPDKIRLVQIRDFKSNRFLTYIPKGLARRFFVEDDVMIGRYGPPVFQILRGLSGSYNVALMKALPKGEVTKDFVYFLLQEKKLHDYVVANSERTAGQTGVNLDLLEKYPAYVPPLPLQQEFARQVAAIDRLKAAHQASLAKLDELAAALQHRAFRGELTGVGLSEVEAEMAAV